MTFSKPASASPAFCTSCSLVTLSSFSVLKSVFGPFYLLFLGCKCPALLSLQRDFLYLKTKVTSLFWGPLDTSPLLSDRVSVSPGGTLCPVAVSSSRMLHDCRIHSVKKICFVVCPTSLGGDRVTVAFLEVVWALDQTHLNLNLSAYSVSELSLDNSLSLSFLLCKTRAVIAPSEWLWRL